MRIFVVWCLLFAATLAHVADATKERPNSYKAPKKEVRSGGGGKKETGAPVASLKSRQLTKKDYPQGKGKGGQKDDDGLYFRTPHSDPFPAQLRLVDDPAILDGYKQCNDLYTDVTQALRFIASSAILQTSKGGYYRGSSSRYSFCRYYKRGKTRKKSSPTRSNKRDSDGTQEQNLASGSSSEEDGEGVDDFGTNNQVEGVDEADILKSDGTYVYAAYGNQVVIWQADTGLEVSRTKMKKPRRIEGIEDNNCFGPGKPKKADYYWSDRNDPSATVDALLLHEDRLAVVVSMDRGCECPGDDSPKREDRILFDPRRFVQVNIYDTSRLGDGGSLPLLGTTDLEGTFLDARSLGSIVHVVTSTTPDLATHFTNGLRLSLGKIKNKKKRQRIYRRKATRVAARKIPQVARAVMRELTDGGKITDCSKFVKIAIYATADGDEIGDADETFIRDAGLLRQMSTVTSFDMTNGRGLQRKADATHMFVPGSSSSYGHELYASQDVLVLAARGYRRSEQDLSWIQTTFLTSFKLNDDGEAATPFSLGRVPGSMINQFAMDQYGPHLRVATSIGERWGCKVFNENADETTTVWRRCRKWGRVSGTDNQLSILEFPSTENPSPVMRQVGLLQGLGKPGERIFSVRFLGDKAYVVTFRQVDPFYILDLSNPEKPKATGELEISGFSNYLHPIKGDDEDGEYILAIGEETDKRGRSLGFQMSIFDVNDSREPKLLHRYIIEERKDTWSSSDAQWEHKAFRYVEALKVAILPVEWSRWKKRKHRYYDGFFVYSVSTQDGIDVLFDVKHGDHKSGVGRCYSSAYMPARSMVFDSNVMTVKGHSVQSHDIDTEDELWTLDLDADLANTTKKKNCHGWWWR